MVTDLGVPTPDIQEIEEDVGGLQNNKAAGVDQLPSELLKYGGQALDHYQDLGGIYITRGMDVTYRVSYIKSDKFDCGNYRAICHSVSQMEDNVPLKPAI